MTDPAKQSTHATHPPSSSEGNLRRRFFRNTTALVVGWNLNSLGRLITAALVVRSLGTPVFGEYAVIVMWLTIAEWILDFGTTEVFVREANQAPQRREHLVRTFLALKGIQAPLAVLVLLAGLLVMRYPQRIVVGGIVAGVSLIFFGGVSLCRAMFKSTLTMEREVASEFVSVIVMMSFVPIVSRSGWGLMGLMTAYVLSRGVFLGCCVLLSRSHLRFSVKGVKYEDIRWAVHSSAAIGFIGFVVVVHNATDLLVLSRLAGLSDVAIYSAAQRFTLPLTMALSAVSASVYPVLSLVKSPARFHETCQRAVDTTILIGGLAVVCLWSGAEFLLNLLGSELVAGSNALRILAVMCVIKSLAMITGPVLFLVRAQGHALKYMLMALALKVAVMAAVIPRFGYLGAAAGTLCVETLFLVPVTLYSVRAFAGFKIRYSVILRVAAIAIGVVMVTRTLLPASHLASIMMSATLYVALVLGSRTVRISQLRALVRTGS